MPPSQRLLQPLVVRVEIDEVALAVLFEKDLVGGTALRDEDPHMQLVKRA